LFEPRYDCGVSFVETILSDFSGYGTPISVVDSAAGLGPFEQFVQVANQKTAATSA
jgi:hypothetical protein